MNERKNTVKKHYKFLVPCMANGAVRKMLKERLRNNLRAAFPGYKEADCLADQEPSTADMTRQPSHL